MTVLKTKMKRNFITKDAGTEALLSRSLQYLKAGYPVHFTGPSGVGKTSLALALAKKRNRPVMLIHGNHELNNQDLIGDFTGYTSKKMVDNYIRSVYKREENVTETWKDGRLLEAVKNGYTLVYDEFTRSKPSTNNIFLSILEEGVLPLYGTKLTDPFVRVHPEFSVIFTSNPEEYAGVYQTQDALLDRLITMFVERKDSSSEAAIIADKEDISSVQARLVTDIVSRLREKCKGDQGPSLRASLMIARIASEEDIAIDGNQEAFQKLCIDILGHQVSRCLETEEPLKEAVSLIQEACKSAGAPQAVKEN
ncbi:gas vesicle protein GvpN [Bacillus lacus]|uniref:Gas vesicle protein GvpN n=1 Tax=Metabacillus lacus TaxID=1983721 RepID=A0A7X2IX32_9BACI|nr:gas vesicle protein GvpN [Metabacillus lacus]